MFDYIYRHIFTMAYTEAMKQAQKRYRMKNKEKYKQYHRKSRLTYYHKNRNYVDIDNMGKPLQAMFAEG